MSLKVLVIDDSAYNRSALTALLCSIPGVEVAGTAVDGVDGIRQTKRILPDLIMLDLEMPNMDGFTFLRLLRNDHQIPVIVVSGTDAVSGASMAFELGALDYIQKPTRSASAKIYSLRGELKRKLGGVSGRRKASGRYHTASSAGPRTASVGPAAPAAYVLGSSTGGPGAVSDVIKRLPTDFPAVFAVTIHMPAWLTVPFVKRLDAESSINVLAARHGQPVREGVVYVAPGGYHLGFRSVGPIVYTDLSRRGPGDLNSPSIDHMFSSAARVWGSALVGVVMTGMGKDGSAGAADIKENGGYVIAQSPESSVAPGMPVSVTAAGLADAVLDPSGIAGAILAGNRRSRLKMA